VRDLLAASDKAEREELLLAAEPMVVVDLDRMLAGANRDEVATLRIAAGEALESYRAGYLWSAQALATAAVGSVVHGHLGYRTWTDAREAFEALDIEEQGLRRFRLGALQGSLARAITPYRPSDPPPVDYNRHASAHGVSRSQYRPVNSLAAVMLLATLTTELNTLFRLTNRGGEVD
jgi:hypothetical protein